jgi:hypothetical protein
MHESGGFPPLSGCSSMVEQKLPKLLTFAEIRHEPSKTSPKIAVSIQSSRNRQQNNFSLALTSPHPPVAGRCVMGLRQYQFGPGVLTIDEGRFRWLRVGRYVLILRRPDDQPLFSDRYGHVRVLRLGRGWRITARRTEPIKWRIRMARR